MGESCFDQVGWQRCCRWHQSAEVSNFFVVVALCPNLMGASVFFRLCDKPISNFLVIIVRGETIHAAIWCAGYVSESIFLQFLEILNSLSPFAGLVDGRVDCRRIDLQSRILWCQSRNEHLRKTWLWNNTASIQYLPILLGIGTSRMVS